MNISDYFDTVPPLLIKFLMYKQSIQSCSKLTVFEYLMDLRMFLRYQKLYKTNAEISEEQINGTNITDVDIDFIKSISTEDIYTFLFYISEDRESNVSTRARKLSSIKSFFKYLNVKANLIEINPAENIDSPTIRQALPKYLTLEESKKLLSVIAEDAENKERTRNYCMVVMFLNCGLRLSELTGIDLKDISKENGTVRILGKRNKERFIYINDAVSDALDEYLEERSKIPDIIDKEALFVTKRERKRVSNSIVQKTVKKYFELAGFGDRDFSTHKLRHTAATLMHQYGNVDVRVLQEILGHEQLNTTQIYTHINEKQLKKAADANPLSSVGKRKKKKEEWENKNEDE